MCAYETAEETKRRMDRRAARTVEQRLDEIEPKVTSSMNAEERRIYRPSGPLGPYSDPWRRSRLEGGE